MLSAARALALNSKGGPKLPLVPDLQALYDARTYPRQNEMVMIAGRPGHQKSGFALWLTAQWGLPTLYFSADMSPFQASMRLACMKAGRTLEQMERGLAVGSVDIDELLGDLPITFSFGKPITFPAIEHNVEAFVELWGDYPAVMVFDNLMDFEAGESDYAAQMAILQDLDAIKSDLGCTVVVLHHATDKGKMAIEHPELPPPRSEIKGGLAEKPELTLGVALNPLNLTYNIATLKQRMGPSDPSGARFVTLQADPAKTQFHRL